MRARLKVYGDGEQTRDFVNVKDVVEANMLALSERNAVGEVFNVSTGEAIIINTLAKILQEIMGKTNLGTVHADARTEDVRDSYADTSKTRKILGYKPTVKLEKGLKELNQMVLKKLTLRAPVNFDVVRLFAFAECIFCNFEYLESVLHVAKWV